MNTSAKHQANRTESVEGVVRTRFCRQTDRLTNRQADSSIPPTNFVCGGIINVTEKMKFALGRVENIEGKGENAGTIFSKGFFLWVTKSWDCVVKS